MKYDIAKLDAQMRFLQAEAKSLRELKKVWADSKASRFEEISETLRQVRQAQQMTGINGEKIQ